MRVARVSCVSGRLPGFSYTGRHRYFVTCTTRDRLRLFESDAVVAIARDELLRTADDYGFAVVAYSFMPDHVHALVRGTGVGSNFRLFTAAFRGRSSRNGARTCSLRLWQRGYHERVLRDHDPTERVVAYIVSNPVRAGFVTDPMTYRFSWAEGWPAKVSQPS